MTLRYGAATDRGRMREGNEDNLVSRNHLFAVADGMGGHQGGEVASRIAVETLAEIPDGGPWMSEQQAKEILRDSVIDANRKIRQLAASDRSLEGMGTTLTAVLEDGYTVHLAHIGDSRAYLYSGGHLSLLTEDHTLVQQLVKENRLTPEEAEHHPQKSIITRALGVEEEVDPDLDTYQRRPGDRLLLCTDGLSNMVEDDELRRVLQKVRDPQQAADELIALANAAGGHDNITVVVLDTEEAPNVQGDTSELRDVGMGMAPQGHGGTGPITPVTPDQHGMTGVEEFEPQRLAMQMDPTRGERGRGHHTRSRSGGRVARRVLAAVGALVVVAVAAFGAQAYIYSNYWVGFDNDQVVVYEGMPGEIAGIRLARVVERTGTTRAEVPVDYQPRLEEGVPRESREEAVRWAHCAAFVFDDLAGCIAGFTGQAPAQPSTTTPDTTTTSAPAGTPGNPGAPTTTVPGR